MIESRKLWQDVTFSDAIEGGYSAPRDGDPHATNHGITLTTLQAVKAPAKVTIDDLKRLTIEDAKAIASANYWSPIQGDRLPGGVDVAVADCSFNSGPRQATKILQRCLGFTGKDVDGFLGVLTLTAVEARSPRGLIMDYQEARLKFMRCLDNWPQNAKGWTRRVDAMTKLALSLAPASAQAPAVVAANDETKRNYTAWAAGIGTGLTTIVPAIVESLPAAQQGYANMEKALGPFAQTLPWLVPLAGAAIMGLIIFLKIRGSSMAANAAKAGASAVVVAAPAPAAVPVDPVVTAAAK